MAAIILGGSVVIGGQTYDRVVGVGAVTFFPWGKDGIFVEVTPAGRVLVYGPDARFLPHELEGEDALPFVQASR
jgi:hypothetical protein